MYPDALWILVAPELTLYWAGLLHLGLHKNIQKKMRTKQKCDLNSPDQPPRSDEKNLFSDLFRSGQWTG